MAVYFWVSQRHSHHSIAGQQRTSRTADGCKRQQSRQTADSRCKELSRTAKAFFSAVRQNDRKLNKKQTSEQFATDRSRLSDTLHKAAVT